MLGGDLKYWCSKTKDIGQPWCGPGRGWLLRNRVGHRDDPVILLRSERQVRSKVYRSILWPAERLRRVPGCVG